MGSIKGAKNMTPVTQSNDAIREWIKEWISKETGMNPSLVADDENFVNFGISSAQGAMFSGDISDWLGINLDPTLIWDYPTIDALVAFIDTQHRV
jgi:acyl carrier protein